MGRRRMAQRGAALVAAVAIALGAAPTGARAEDAGSAASEVAADWHTLRTPALEDGQFELLTTSTLPDAVTGGDVVVAVRGLAADAPLTVTRDGADVTDAFTTSDDGERSGLVTGLALGDNTLEARSGDRVATLVVRNHPLSGPVLSGPHQTPFRCETERAGLGAPLDEDCQAPTSYQWFYRSTNDQAFHPLVSPYAAYPGDVMTTVRSDGDAVPFVVRVETNTLNRSITRIAVLDDPAGRGPDAPFDAGRWNGRVYHAFGESCGVGYRQGGNSPETVLGAIDLSEISADNLLINLTGITDRLSKGDATIHSTLTAFGNHCNPLISIETMLMIKEHLNEQYGPVDVIVGTNGSGAALQQWNAVNNAPGLIDAAMPTATFADIVTTAMTVTDCGLLQHYYETTTLEWSDAQKWAVNGHNLLSGNQANAICQSWNDTFLSVLDPTSSCAVPDELKYDPEDNPTGTRCTIQDANVNVFGRDPETGFARRPIDNVGVQYGLGALRSGVITPAQFVDLNLRIGGYDIDGQHQRDRHAMESEVASLAYRLGGVIGRGAIDETPVMDIAPYLDLIPIANIHEAVRPFVIRARLREHTGQDETQSIWRGLLTQADAYPVMEQWLAAVEAGRPGYGGDHTAAVIAAKPASAGDRCAFGTLGGRLELPDAIITPLGLAQLPLLPGVGLPGVDIPLRVDVPEDFDSGLGPCSIALPVTRTPRMVAGMPLSDDIIKCQLQPIAAGTYGGALSGPQLEALRAAFPDGVCDFSKPAAEDVAASLQWVSVGGDELEAPHELRWRVARSVVATPAAIAPPTTSGGTLPATGGAWPLGLAVLALLSALALARLRRA